jgi:hypothetical protein
MFEALSVLPVRTLCSLISWSSHWTYFMFGALILAIIMGTWAGAVAGRKGRSMQKWFLFGFFVPLVGLIASYIIKPVSPGNKQVDGN